MKKHYTKLLSLLLVAAFLIASVAACGGGGDTGTPAQQTSAPASDPGDSGPAGQDDTEAPAADGDVYEFDLYFYASWGTFYPWIGSIVEDWIIEDTGVRPNIIVPTGNDTEYLGVIIASGDLPDAMVLEWGQPETKRLIQQGLIHSINDLSEQYSPGFMDEISSDVQIYHGQDDGKLYYLPSFMPSQEEWETGLAKHNARPFFIQRGIFEELGSPRIDTDEKFIQLLRDIKEKYPDMNPFLIESPVEVTTANHYGSETIRFLAGLFAPETYSHDYWLDTDGTLRFVFENANVVRAIGFLNQIYREGLISSDTLMIRSDAFGDEFDSARYAVAARFPIDIWKGHNPNIMALHGDAGKTFMPLEYFWVDGKEPQFAGTRGPGWVASMVTTNAEDPGRIINYFRYLWSDEGQITVLFGREGESFEWVNGLPRYLPELLEEQAVDGEAWENKWGFERRHLLWRSYWDGLYKLALAPEEYADYLRSVEHYAVDIWELGLSNLRPDPGTREGTDLERIEYIWNEGLAKMVFAKDEAEFNAVYATAMEDIAAANLEGVRAVMYENHLKDKAIKTGG